MEPTTYLWRSMDVSEHAVDGQRYSGRKSRNLTRLLAAHVSHADEPFKVTRVPRDTMLQPKPIVQGPDKDSLPPLRECFPVRKFPGLSTIGVHLRSAVVEARTERGAGIAAGAVPIAFGAALLTAVLQRGRHAGTQLTRYVRCRRGRGRNLSCENRCSLDEVTHLPEGCFFIRQNYSLDCVLLKN